MFKMRFLRSSECLKTTLNSPEQPLELIQNFATVTKIHTKHTKHTHKQKGKETKEKRKTRDTKDEKERENVTVVNSICEKSNGVRNRLRICSVYF